ncbi:PorP/SprF family type IX secretion system membrane protein [Labilibacter marinus]|uniref:PorP/SprF family type IX secretion system membrane protein n=1 Tax=Labilibacter marinus TaxID=1477105 RepID=UPI00082CF32D|nr:PorP/SprF family type IX secretion system membrane protein [Labilibacter marinus]
MPKNYLLNFSFLLLFTLFSVDSRGQENTIFTDDYLDPFITNPAFSGVDEYFKAHLSAKKRWVGIPDAPGSALLSTNFRIGKYDFYNPNGLVYKGPLKLRGRIGVGASLFQENYGPIGNTGGILSYAYHLPLKQKSNLSFGLSVILLNQSLKTSELRPDEPGDSYLFSGNNSSFKAKIGGGVLYRKKAFFIGLSMMKYVSDNANMLVEVTEDNSYFTMLGYKFKTNKKGFVLEPLLAVKKINNSSVIMDVHAKCYLGKHQWFALSYSTLNNMNVRCAFRLYRMFYFGYNFAYGLGDVKSYNYGSHQVSLGINLGLNGFEFIQ